MQSVWLVGVAFAKQTPHFASNVQKLFHDSLDGLRKELHETPRGAMLGRKFLKRSFVIHKPVFASLRSHSMPCHSLRLSFGTRMETRHELGVCATGRSRILTGSLDSSLQLTPERGGYPICGLGFALVGCARVCATSLPESQDSSAPTPIFKGI